MLAVSIIHRRFQQIIEYMGKTIVNSMSAYCLKENDRNRNCHILQKRFKTLIGVDVI